MDENYKIRLAEFSRRIFEKSANDLLSKTEPCAFDFRFIDLIETSVLFKLSNPGNQKHVQGNYLSVEVEFEKYNFSIQEFCNNPDSFSDLVVETLELLEKDCLDMERLGFTRMEGFHAYSLFFKNGGDYFSIRFSRIGIGAVKMEILVNGRVFKEEISYQNGFLYKNALDMGFCAFSLLPGKTRDLLVSGMA